MRQTICYSAVIVILTAFFSCKKDAPLRFIASGFWKGSVTYYVAVLHNTDDGKSRLFMQVPGQDGADTASATIKYYGVFTVSKNNLRAAFDQGGADSIILQTNNASPDHISGIIYSSTYNGAFLPFEFSKQQ